MRLKDEQKKARLYQAAIRVINERGFDGASVSSIAQLADVSPATLYLHFACKQDMLNKLYLALCEEMGARLCSRLDPDIPPRAQVYRVWKDVLDYARELPEHFYFLEQFTNCPKIDAISHEQGQQYFAALKHWYDFLRAERVLRDLPDALIDAHLFYPLIALIKAEWVGELTLTDDLLTSSFDASWRALAQSPDS